MHFQAYANRVMSLNDFTNQEKKRFSKTDLKQKYRNENAEYIQKSICWIEW